MAETNTATGITKVATVMVPVKDQDRAIDFYVSKLGLEKRVDVPFGQGDRWVEVGVTNGAETTLALMTPPPQSNMPIPMPGCLCSLYTDDIERDHAALKAGGVDVDAEVMRPGAPAPPMFFFRDVDGNNLLLVGSL